jgi:hypothetical protein
VTPGTYPCPTYTVDAQGTLTNSESGTCGNVSDTIITGPPTIIANQGDLAFDASVSPPDSYVQFFGPGTPPSVEGSPATGTYNGQTAVGPTEISTSASNLMLVYFTTAGGGGGAVSSVTSSAGDTYYQVAVAPTGNSIHEELWCATLSGPRASDEVTVHLGGAGGYEIVTLIGVENAKTGVNCATASFDNNPSLPVTSGLTGVQSATVSTNVPNDLIIWAEGAQNTGYGTAPASFSTLSQTLTGNTSLYLTDETLSALISNQTIGWTKLTGGNGAIDILAAVSGNLGSQQWFKFGGGLLRKLTVATLPACSGANEGQLYWVTDASSPTWGGALTGGSTTGVLGACNGSAWVAQ